MESVGALLTNSNGNTIAVGVRGLPDHLRSDTPPYDSRGWASPPLSHEGHYFHSPEHSPADEETLRDMPTRSGSTPALEDPSRYAQQLPCFADNNTAKPMDLLSSATAVSAHTNALSPTLRTSLVGAHRHLPESQDELLQDDSDVDIRDDSGTDGGLLLLFASKSEVYEDGEFRERSEGQPASTMLTQSSNNIPSTSSHNNRSLFRTSSSRASNNHVAPIAGSGTSLSGMFKRRGSENLNFDWMTEVRDDVMRERSIHQEHLSTTVTTLSKNANGTMEKDTAPYLI